MRIWIGKWLIRALMPVLAVVLVVVWLLVALVPSRRRRALRLATMALVYAVGETVAMVICFGLWLVRAGPRPHLWLLRVFLGTLLRLAGPVLGFRLVVEEPSRELGRQPLIVLARHAGPGASFALVHLLMSRYRRHPVVVLKEQLRLDPAIDILLTRIGCSWIPTKSEGSADRIGEAAAGLTDDQALVLFPEGADWTPFRHLAAVARLRRKGLFKEARAALRMPHVLPPRPAGTVAALEAAPSAEVLVFTHCGHDELLDMGKAWEALPLREPLQMTWWWADDIPPGREEQWLQQTWRDIDAWVEARA